MPSAQMSRVREPRQIRSVETYSRLIDAAEEILLTTSFDEATVAEISARAHVTIGAFYARFRDKEALFRHLEERMTEDFATIVDQDVDAFAHKDLEAVVTAHHRRLIAAYRRQRAVARALVLRSHRDSALRGRLEKLNARNLPRFARAVRRHADFDHPQPERAIRFALIAVRSVCREVILFGESSPDMKPPSDDELARELTRQFLRYLGLHSTGK